MTLQDLTGSWIVRGEKELAFGDNGVLSLETFSAKSTHGVIASFEFGCVTGTMLLGLSRRSIDLLREEKRKYVKRTRTLGVSTLTRPRSQPRALVSWRIGGDQGPTIVSFKVADQPRSQSRDGSSTTPDEWYVYDGIRRGKMR